RLEVEIVQQFISRSNAANQGLYRDVCVKIVTGVPKGVIPALGLSPASNIPAFGFPLSVIGQQDWHRTATSAPQRSLLLVRVIIQEAGGTLISSRTYAEENEDRLSHGRRHRHCAGPAVPRSAQ